MLIKLVVKIYSLNLVSAYHGYTLIVFMTQGYLTAKSLRTTGLNCILTLCVNSRFLIAALRFEIKFQTYCKNKKQTLDYLLLCMSYFFLYLNIYSPDSQESEKDVNTSGKQLITLTCYRKCQDITVPLKIFLSFFSFIEI